MHNILAKLIFGDLLKICIWQYFNLVNFSLPKSPNLMCHQILYAYGIFLQGIFSVEPVSAGHFRPKLLKA